MSITELTKKELAGLSGLTYRRLFDIDAGLPEEKKLFVKGKGGKYDLALFVQRWVAYNVDREQDATGKSLEEVKAIHEVVKTRKTELEVAKLEGRLVDVQDVKRMWADIANSVMQNMLTLPRKIAPRVTMMESIEIITGIMDEEIRKVLENIAETPLPDYVREDIEKEDEEDTEG